MASKRLLVRQPASTINNGNVTFIERVDVDYDEALKQWRAYVAEFESRGWDIINVPTADELPDSVFVEDTAVMFGDLAVLTNPERPSRAPEVAGTESVLNKLGVEIARITAGYFEGGDVLKVGKTVFVGLTGSTDQAAIDQLSQILSPRGWNVVAVPVTKALHLKSAITALPDHTIIGYPPIVDDPELFAPYDYLPVPEEPGSHVVVLDDTHVLISSGAVKTQELLKERGLVPVPVAVSEFEKLEGCVTCLSVRMRGIDAD